MVGAPLLLSPHDTRDKTFFFSPAIPLPPFPQHENNHAAPSLQRGKPATTATVAQTEQVESKARIQQDAKERSARSNAAAAYIRGKRGAKRRGRRKDMKGGGGQTKRGR